MPSPARPYAIVTDGLWRKSLSVIRSVGKAGFRTCVMGNSVFTTGFWSRYTTNRMIAPTAAQDLEAYGDALKQALRRHPGAVIFPMEDPSLRWIVDHSEEYSQGRFLLPSREAIRVTQDKGETLKLAERTGIPCPKTWRPDTDEAFAKQAMSLERGMFVVKPRSGSGSAGIVYGALPDLPGADDLSRWKAHWKTHGPMLIQERIPADGVGRGVSLLMDQHGECVAAFAHERLQQYPNSGGPSTDRHGILAPDLLEKSIHLLRSLSWRGIAMVEWKVDPRDGVAKLMEINPRFWGSLELAVRSGVDFPALYARAAMGERVGLAPPYRAGIRCRWMVPGEVLRYLTQPKNRRERLRDFLRGLPRLAEEWDPKDLRGAIATVVCTAALALNPRYWKYVLRG